jgi:hypothetical protein
MIRVYPSVLSDAPLEQYDAVGITIHQWLSQNVQGYSVEIDQPISVFANGIQIPPCDWDLTLITQVGIDIYVQPKGSALPWVIGAIFASIVVAKLLTPKIKLPNQVDRQSGRQITIVESVSNQARYNEPIPEIAGSPRRYPDYLNEPRRRFGNDNKTQIITMLFCVGKGHHQLSANDIHIGETRLTALSEISADIRIYQPGQVIDHEASQLWYNVPEVGGTRRSSGIELQSGQDGTPFANSQIYRIDQREITIPIGLGNAPQDWEIGNKVRISTPIRSVTVVKSLPGRDKIRGFFSDLGLVVGDEVVISGLNADGSRFKIHSYTPGVPSAGGIVGSPSSVEGSDVAEVDYTSAPLYLQVNNAGVLLNQNYVNHSALVNALNAQLAGVGVTASQSAGVLKFTESSPYSGQSLVINTLFEEVFGDDPIITTGTQTVAGTPATQDELTLDVGVNVELGVWNLTVFSWLPLTSLAAGSRSNVSIDLSGAEYVIDSIVYEIVLDENNDPTQVAIGWEFYRIKNNAIDLGFTGFAGNGTFTNLSIAFDNSQSVGGWAGPYELIKKGDQAQRVEWDIMAPNGLGFVRDNGSIQTLSRVVQLQYSTDGINWITHQQALSGATQDQLGWTFVLDLPEPATTLKARFRRIGAQDTRVQAMDRLELYGVRSLVGNKSLYPGVTVIALSMQGSEIVSAQSESQLWCMPTRVLPSRSGGDWSVMTPTRSIVDFVGHVARTIGYDDSQLLLTDFDRLQSIWSARGDVFDHVFDNGTIQNVMNTCLRAGFAEMSIHRGQIRLVRDEPRSIYDHAYTPENTVSPLRSRVKMLGVDEYDGVDVEYIDRDSWVKQVVECRLPGDLGLKCLKITLEGVTDRSRAWRIGMRERRSQRYIRWQYSFQTEMDALNSRYLDYVALVDNVPGYGSAGIINGIVNNSGDEYIVSISESFDFSDDNQHIFSWRRSDGTLSGPYPAVEYGHCKIIVTMPSNEVPESGAHYVLGAVNHFCFDALIKMINPQSLTKVNVEAEGYDARKYLDDDNTPPV